VATRASVKWGAVKALHEGAHPSAELLATVAELKPKTVRNRAEAENWRCAAPDRKPADRAVRIGRLADSLMDQVELVGTGEDGSFDKTRIEAIAAMTRTVEKIGDITRGAAVINEEDIKRDADIGTILQRIDERIVELARLHAERLGGARAEGASA
jgi:hypothetical protein